MTPQLRQLMEQPVELGAGHDHNSNYTRGRMTLAPFPGRASLPLCPEALPRALGWAVGRSSPSIHSLQPHRNGGRLV